MRGINAQPVSSPVPTKFVLYLHPPPPDYQHNIHFDVEFTGNRGGTGSTLIIGH